MGENFFGGGTVMGLGVAGLVLGLTGFLYFYNYFFRGRNLWLNYFRNFSGFSLGLNLSFIARVGGGIYTKAADVGADLVGKVEADIPEDDQEIRSITDNVGDNVGDVAGMGADLFGSYVATVLAWILETI